MTLNKSKIVSTLFNVTALCFVAYTCGVYVATNADVRHASVQTEEQTPIIVESNSFSKLELSE
jgi:hypothetical protein